MKIHIDKEESPTSGETAAGHPNLERDNISVPDEGKRRVSGDNVEPFPLDVFPENTNWR